MNTTFSFPPVLAVNLKLGKNTIQQLSAPGFTSTVSIVAYKSVAIKGANKHKVEGYILTPNGSGDETTFAVIEGSEFPEDYDRVVKVRLNHSTGATPTIDQTSSVWINHPMLKVRSQDRKEDLSGATNVLNSWKEGFSFIEEDPSKRLIGLRRPQIGALHSLHGHWAVSDETATIVMPTGTGKTETMLSILVSYRCPRVLVIVPTDALRDQISEKFLTLGMLKRKDSRVLSPACLYPIVGVLKTRPKNISEVDSFFPKCNVIVTTIQIAGQCDEAVQTRMAFHCSDLFIDEAHHVPAATWDRFKGRFKDRRVVQFTATPFREDDKPIEGKLIFKYPMSKAQNDGYFSKLHFKGVREFEPKKADRAVAEAALEQLRADREKYDHILMARVDSTKRAEEVFQIYEEFREFKPVRIHSKLERSEREVIRRQILSGESKIIVCVDMLGEGFDLPELKIAAFHDVKKSLAVTLQIAGRLTRSRNDLGHATVIANVGDVDVREELRKLYYQDPDWNVILPELSESIIQGQHDLADLISGFKQFPKEIPLQSIRPALSAVVYKTKCRNWKPDNYANGIPGISFVDRVFYDVNRERKIAVLITVSKVGVEWAQLTDLSIFEWNLYILYWDKEQNLLFINASANEGQYKKLAEAVAGSDARLIHGEPVFRCFSGINRLRLQNVGLSEHLGRLIRYNGRMGSDVESGLTEVQKRKASKTVAFGTGYEGGLRASVGCSAKGKIWSYARTSNLDELQRWCSAIGKKITNESINPDEVLKNTLVAEIVSQRPNKMPIAIDWPENFYKEPETAFTFLLDGNRELPFYRAEINLVDPSERGDLRFVISNEKLSAEFVLKVIMDRDESTYSFSVVGDRKVDLKINARVMNLIDYFYDHPPVIWFVDGSSLQANRLFQLKRKVDPFPREKITVWDWTGVSIKKESQGINKKRDSIQFRLIETLKKNKYNVIVDDDDSGEAADVVAIEVTESPNAQKRIHVELYHCKFSLSDKAGERIKDLYEVCGQAQKSIHWLEDSPQLFSHLLRRDPRIRGNLEFSRLERGTRDDLFEIYQMSRLYPVSFSIYVVQPGLSQSGASNAQLELLSVTENHLMETYQIPFGIISSS